MKPTEGSTVIGKSVVIRGDLSGNEDLYIDGDIEGTITLADSRLTIGPNARVRANVIVSDIIVFGHLTGNVHATGRVELRQSAFVQGDILAGRLSIEESAILKGSVELKSASEGRVIQSGTPAAPTEATATGTPLFPQAQN
jgi:cytoskeletal protein CcmA (bactofilin family)